MSATVSPFASTRVPGLGGHNGRAMSLEHRVDYWHQDAGGWFVLARRPGFVPSSLTLATLDDVHRFCDVYLSPAGSLAAALAVVEPVR